MKVAANIHAFCYKIKRDNLLKVRFIWIGTIEFCRYYDVLIGTFKILSEYYREKNRLYFVEKHHNSTEFVNF